MTPLKQTLRRAHPNSRACWEWTVVCQNCGTKKIDDWHGIDREIVVKYLNTGKL